MPGKDNQSGKPELHQRQFVDFRVSVFRLRVPNNPELSVAGITKNVNDILAASYSEQAYQEIAEALNKVTGVNKQGEFVGFLEKFYGLLKGAIYKPNGDPKTIDELISEGVFVEDDVTPLCSGYTSTCSIDEMNTCSLQVSNIRHTSFDGANLSSYQKNSYSGKAVSRRVQNQMAFKAEVPFKLFDLIRVHQFAAPEAPVSRADRLARTALNGAPAPLTSTDYVFRPVFTGLVADIMERNSGSGGATFEIRAAGLKRMMSQSVTVFSEALAPVVTTASPELGILNGKFTVFENSFNEMSADAVFKKIMEEYFSASFLTSRSRAGADPVVGVPRIGNVFRAMFKKSTIPDSAGNATELPVNLVPMLPTILLIHMLKMRYREPIAICDDRTEGIKDTFRGSLFASERNPIQAESSHKLPDMVSVMKPYLTRVKSSFANYDTSYSSASEVFDTIKEATFMEIFEDKKGQFHFRFPKYNQSRIVHDIDLSRMVDCDIRKSDSAIYTACVAQRMIPLSSSNGIIDGRVFVDKLSILKYGLRRPQSMENPNAVNEGFARALAKFARDYRAGRDATTASITCIGDPSIEPGDMVAFRSARIQRVGKNQSAPNSQAPSGVMAYCGYVVSVTDSFRVSGQYMQTLELAFVREATVSKSTTGLSSVFLQGSVWDAVDATSTPVTPIPIETELPFDSVTTGTTNSTLGSASFDSDFLITFRAPPERFSYVTAAYVPSSIDLAMETARYAENVKEAADNTAGLLRSLDHTASEADYKQQLEAMAAVVKGRSEALAQNVAMRQVVDAMLGTLELFRPQFRSSKKSDAIQIGKALDATIDKANKGPARNFTVKVTVEGRAMTSVVIDNKQIPLQGTVGADGRLFPGFNMEYVMAQIEKTYPSLRGMASWYRAIFVEEGMAVYSGTNTLTNEATYKAASIGTQLIDWARQLSNGLKASVENDEVIDKTVRESREVEAARDAAKARKKSSSSSIQSIPADNAALAQAANTGVPPAGDTVPFTNGSTDPSSLLLP